ncbi:MAG TPA: rhodanese-like domain-containing protein [Dehalococcoidia bacterium]|nr:rhodanese-like domain-containing protein [Dehalococcoidia bacterium]
MVNETSVRQLTRVLEDGKPFALIDVRETAEYNLAHIAGSTSIPRRLLELRMQDMVPFAGTRTIVCDDDGRRASLAAQTLASIGYTDVSVLAGGLNRWVSEDMTTEWGVNVPSKDFGEKLLLQQHVPEITADELHERMRRGDKMVILDSRTPEEHNRACIPGSRSMPGAELGLRVWDLMEDENTTVVVHCAGRTRSLVGAGTLQRMGVKNVVALKNGTMGWQLAGLTPEQGSDRLSLPTPSPQAVQRAEKTAREIATAEGVRFVDVVGAQALMARAAGENVYLLDVRTREEYVAGHIPGFRWAPGGQAVQATDSYVAVTGAAILFACDASTVRSSMTASWFRQMGFGEVFVLEGGAPSWAAAGHELEPGPSEKQPFGYDAARSRLTALPPAEVQARLGDAASIFVGTSDQFSDGHLPGSRWVPRSWLELRVGEVVTPGKTPVIVTCVDGVQSALAGATLRDLGYEDVSLLEGGTSAWRAAGLALETGLAGVTQAPDDVLPVRRSYAEMLNYLRWEEELGEKYKTG